MDTQAQQELQDRLAELQAIVNLYNPTEGLWACISFLSFQAICAIVITDFASSWGIYGVLAGILLLALFIVPVAIYVFEECKPKKQSPSNKELAKQACALMSACIQRYKDPGREVYILNYRSYESNLPLYKEFISIFPHMESKKLKKLSTIKLRA